MSDKKTKHAQVMRKAYSKKRAFWIANLGGKCIDCGSTEQLEFDHANSVDKSFNVSKMFSYRNEVLQPEMEKCVLRCQPCHVIKSKKHGDLRQVEHGGGAKGKRGCNCLLCKAKRTEYNQTYIRPSRRK